MESAVDPLAMDTPTNGDSNGSLDPATGQVKLPECSTEVDNVNEELLKMDQAVVEEVAAAVMLEEVPMMDVPMVEKGNDSMEVITECATEAHSNVVHPEFVESTIPAEEDTHILHVQETHEEIIQAEMAEIHQDHDVEQSAILQTSDTIDLHLQLEESTESMPNDSETEQDVEGEMILEETTGEYVLASSLKTKSEVPEKKTKMEAEDMHTVAKLIEENLKGGDMQPGEQLVVVTSDEKGNTKEVVLTHTKTVTENGVTIQHVIDESGEVYLIETLDSAEEIEEEDAANIPVRPRRNRKKLQIPNHVLGRNIINPVEDTFRNGKAPPKPRLGVKIPYRNLTSQIVSKAEIAEEILERSRRFSRENPRQNMFARKLTQNLVKKLQPKDAKGPIGVTSLTRGRGRPGAGKGKKDGDKLDNSDLLAILEGDDATTESTASEEPQKDTKEEMTTEKEREIALKQLSELPDDPPEPPKKPDEEQEQPTEKKPDKRTSERGVKSPFTGSAPLKTYGRKRKTSEEVHQLTNPKPSAPKQESLTQKAQAKATPNPSSPDTPATRASRSNSSAAILPQSPENTNNYVTKSSRVIKRKVIWDPDEASPKKGMKVDATPTSKDAKKEGKKVGAEVKKDVKVVKDPKKDAKETPTTRRETRELRSSESPNRKSSQPIMQPKEEPISDSEVETPEKEKPTTPVKAKRRLNEVTKLLMDEGAVNMLYSIKNDDAPTTRRGEKSQQTKADEILNELSALHTGPADRSSPKALRKKESSTPAPAPPKTPKKIMCPPTPSPISRQRSKDSTRSSVHSPPPSPGQSFGGIESRIIRRHSSSSYSSMGEEDDADERRVKKLEGRGRRRALQAAVESDKKKIKIEPGKTASPPSAKTSQIKSKNDNFEKLVEIKLSLSEKYNKYKTFTVSSLNKLVQIDLNVSTVDDSSVYLTNEVMSEITSILADLEADRSVNVVLITSSGTIFCNGLNFKSLVLPKEASRKAAAKKLAKSVSDFLLCLAKFPKVLAAGIHGDSFGIGVTMLPLFDMIISHEDATFTIPNAKLGCIAEGGSLLLLPHLSRNVLVNELLYSSQTLSAEEAIKLGLVTKILTKHTFARELLSTVKGVSDKSAQFMVSTKKQLRKRMIPDITNSLSDETENLIEQWTSEECQKSFTEYFDAE